MIFPGFPGVLSFFQVEWEPCVHSYQCRPFSTLRIIKCGEFLRKEVGWFLNSFFSRLYFRILTTAIFVRVVSTIIVLITHPTLGYAFTISTP